MSARRHEEQYGSTIGTNIGPQPYRVTAVHTYTPALATATAPHQSAGSWPGATIYNPWTAAIKRSAHAATVRSSPPPAAISA